MLPPKRGYSASARGPRTPRARRSRESAFIDWVVFILGVAGAYSVAVVGSLPVCEIMVVFLLPVLMFVYRDRAFRREYRWFYILLAAWLIGTLFADAYRNMPTANRLKGTSRVIFFGLDFAVLTMLIDRRRRRMAIFAASIAVVMFVSAFRFHFDAFSTMWKFGFSSFLTIVSLLVASNFYERGRHWISVSIVLALAATNLIFAFRSQFGVLLAVAALCAFRAFAERRTRFSASMIVALLMTLVTIFYAANKAIVIAAQHGLFDASTQQKFESQAGGKFGTLAGGRPETLVAIRAILDSPIIGHGSYATSQYYSLMEEDLAYQNGYVQGDYTAEDPANDTIPAHSHLSEAWVDSGISGGIFWIYAFLLAVFAITKLMTHRFSLLPLYCYFLVNLCWDIIYSPMGSDNRIWGAFFLMLACDVVWRARLMGASPRRLVPSYAKARVGLASGRHGSISDIRSRYRLPIPGCRPQHRGRTKRMLKSDG